MKILLLDDEPVLGEVILTLLKELKHDAAYVQNYQEALEVLQNSEVDLLIADVVMPGVSGIQLVEKLRQSEQFKNLPVLMISGKAQQSDIVKAAQLGINGFLAKPFRTKELKEKIAKISNKRNEHQRISTGGIEHLWNGRTHLLSEGTGPLLVFGEPINSQAAIQHPSNREIAAYLEHACRAISASNEANPELALGYNIENNTADILGYLKKRGVKNRIKLLLLSTQCPGKPILMARLLTVNKKGDLPVFLIYDRDDDIPANQRQALEKLDVKLVKRSEFDQDKFQQLIDPLIRGQAEETSQIIQEEELSKPEIRKRITEDIEVMTSLPPLPQVYQKIMTLSKNPKSDLKDWIKIIRLDPMTSATILRHANSLTYGFKGEVEDIERAIILLGKNTIAGLVACESMKQAFSSIQEHGFIIEDFWLHCLAVGHAAHILSLAVDDDATDLSQNEQFSALGLSAATLALLKEINLPRRLRLNSAKENPFLGGILHDIGKITMVHSYPGLFPFLLEELEKNQWKLPMLAVEQEVAGNLTHTAVGEVLMRNWGMGKALTNVVLCHHQPEIRDTFSLLISLADMVGQVLYPFPRHAEYPLANALAANKLSSAQRFLPVGFFDQPLCSSEEFISLARAIAPNVKDYVEKMCLEVAA